jgi:hypothetical protein
MTQLLQLDFCPYKIGNQKNPLLFLTLKIHGTNNRSPLQFVPAS